MVVGVAGTVVDVSGTDMLAVDGCCNGAVRGDASELVHAVASDRGEDYSEAARTTHSTSLAPHRVRRMTPAN